VVATVIVNGAELLDGLMETEVGFNVHVTPGEDEEHVSATVPLKVVGVFEEETLRLNDALWPAVTVPERLLPKMTNGGATLTTTADEAAGLYVPSPE
jgi:hypothetical protein